MAKNKRNKQKKHEYHTEQKDKYELLWDTDYSMINIEFEKEFASGRDYYCDLKDIVIESIKDDETKKFINDFLENGGTFKLAHLSNRVMEYDYDNNQINISKELFITKYEDEEMSQIISCVSHELHHSFTFNNAEKTNHNLRNYMEEYDEKSIQIINQGLEVGANYHQIVSGWQYGDKQMFDYLVKDYKDLTHEIDDFLTNKNVKFGNKIPDKLLPAVADMMTYHFTQNDGKKYKKDLAFLLTPERCDSENKKSISAKELFDIMKCPSTFSENELQSMLLFNQYEEKMIPLNSLPFVSVTSNEHQKGIKSKIENYQNQFPITKLSNNFHYRN